jgi:hypothetical protein
LLIGVKSGQRGYKDRTKQNKAEQTEQSNLLPASSTVLLKLAVRRIVLSKICVELDRDIPFRNGPMQKIVQGSWRSSYVGRQNYATNLDLRGEGIDALLHARHRRTGNHKLELQSCDQMNYEEMFEAISKVVDQDPSGLRLMRADFSADVSGYDVSWFRQRAYVPRVRYHEIYGSRIRRGQAQVESLRFGRFPNCLHIYDKLEEARIHRTHNASKFAQFDTLQTVITRVERQLWGNKLPRFIHGFGDLPRAVEFDPFEDLLLVAASEGVGKVKAKTVTAIYAAKGIQHDIAAYGLQAVRLQINRLSPGNASRIINRLIDLEADAGPNLLEIYLRETAAQLRAQDPLHRPRGEGALVGVN